MKNYLLEAEPDKKGFTLMELLVVMTIILILAGIVTPAVTRVIENTKAKKAQQTALQLATSIASYQTEYRRLPLDPKHQAGADVQIETDETLMNVLLGQEGNKLNPGNQSFYTGRNARGRPPRNGLVFNPAGGGRLCDPWGNLYQVMLDVDGNHRIKPPFRNVQISGAGIVAKKVIVWSLGPDGVESGDGAKDNVIIW